MVDTVQKRLLVGLLLDGVVTVAEVARHLEISKQAVHRWVPAAVCQEARRQVAVMAIEMTLQPDQPRRIGRPSQEEERIMRIVAQRNPRKAVVLSKLKKGKISVQQAAREAGVPVSGIVGWCRLHRIALPAEYATPRRRRRAHVEELVAAE